MDVRRRFNSSIRSRRGAAAVELALVLPVLMVILLGMWEIGTVINVRQSLGNAAREAGRQASTGKVTVEEVEQVVRDCLRPSGLEVGSLLVTVENLGDPEAGILEASQFDPIEITVTLRFDEVRLLNAPLFTDSTTMLTGKSTWYSVKNRPYPASPSPPVE